MISKFLEIDLNKLQLRKTVHILSNPLSKVILQYTYIIHSVVKELLYEVSDHYYRELLLTCARTLLRRD
jgi:hypothetical protein